MSLLQVSEVQGLLFAGYGRHAHATYLLLQLGDAHRGRAWVERVSQRVSFGDDRGPGGRLNIAFTAAGFAALGVARDWLETFSPAFWDGMSSAYRSRILSDTGVNAPESWEWGGPQGPPVHALLAIYGRDAAAHDRDVAREETTATDSQATVVRRLEATRPVPGRPGGASEHFGFADGISQPVFAGDPKAISMSADAKRLHLVPTGEFVLGWDNAYQRQTPLPRIHATGQTPFGTNGTYLVFRQLRQDVAHFWQWCEVVGARIGRSADFVAAKSVGRWRDGSPLTLCPSAPNSALSDANEFEFSGDEQGDGCPIGAHIRRTNPRDSLSADRADALRDANTHRILRRGRPYGPRIENLQEDDGVDRGLLFLCLNANPERQFEFVQQSWVNSEAFAGLHHERDPILGTQPSGCGSFSIPGKPLRSRLERIPQFVTVRGGAYFFLPSRAGLAELQGLG